MDSTSRASPAPTAVRPPDFIRAMVAEDLRTGKYDGRVATRFPPEPNGYLHIGHAKSICLNFGLAHETGGVCHLRFDDTNPTTEDIRYTEAIQHDVRWLGFDWHDHLFYASDYFEQLYDYAVTLIERGKAYVDSLSENEIREYRGTITQPGRESPYRRRSVEENLDLFRRMRRGEFDNGAHVLRAKIDMAAPNMLMRDPLLYRIRHARHYRTGDAWCIYPMYDFAHCLSDAIERITHSLCTLEFKDNRDLYDWVLAAVGTEEPRPEQTEFARLDLEHTVLSKRKLVRLVNEGHVSGWDDPRLPTIAGLRRRGVTAEAIRAFCDLIGVAKVDSRVDIGKLEFCVRDDLNQRSPRVMCVLRPLKVVIDNYPKEKIEELEAPYYPHDVPKEGSRRVPFSRELYIERDDFREHPPKHFHRLAPGAEVRLRYAYLIKCVDVVKSPDGEIVELRCTYDPDTRGGKTPDGRQVKGTLHWVSAAHALAAEVRLYDRLFRVPDPDDVPEGHDFIDYLNDASLVTLTGCRIEPSVGKDSAGSRYQFERLGYFCADLVESGSGRLVYNRTVELRDTWAKVSARSEGAPEQRAFLSPRREGARRGREQGKPSRDTAVTFPSPRLEKRYARYVEELGLPAEDAVLLTRDQALSDFYDEALSVHANPRAVANWMINEVLRELKEKRVDTLPFHGTDLGRLVSLIDAGVISGRIAKDVFGEMVARGGDPERIVEAKGLRQITDETALAALVGGVVDRFPEKAAAFQAGREGLLGFFVGQVMRESDGLANPERVEDLLRARLRTGS